MVKLATYSPEDVEVYIASLFRITGFIQGSFIDISRQSKTFTTKEYPDGTVVRGYNSGDLYNVKLTLASSSDSNKILTRLHLVDKATLLGKFPLFIKDYSGESIFFGASCWIDGMAQPSFSTEVSNIEWNIMAPNATCHVGGNYSQSSIVGDIGNIAAGQIRL